MDEWQTNDNPRIALDTKAIEELIEGKQLEKVLENLKRRYLSLDEDQWSWERSYK